MARRDKLRRRPGEPVRCCPVETAGFHLGSVRQDVQSPVIDPDADGPTGKRGTKPDLLPTDPHVPDGGTTRSTSCRRHVKTDPLASGGF